MQNFLSVDALCGVMEKAHQAGAGAPGRDLFAKALVSELAFTKEQAELYASVVLSRNTEGSADRARSTSATVIGKWTHAESQGVNPSVYVKSSQDTWEFKNDLTYEHRQSSYEGYVAPPSPYSTFSYSRPSEHTDRGIWAPPDWWEHGQLTIVIIPVGGAARRFTLAWTDPESLLHSSCRIDGSAYARTY